MMFQLLLEWEGAKEMVRVDATAVEETTRAIAQRLGLAEGAFSWSYYDNDFQDWIPAPANIGDVPAKARA